MSAPGPLAVLDTAPLFAPLHAELMTLLRALSPADFDRPTVAGTWRVRDVAAHLLDGDLRKLSAHRDGHLLAPDRTLTGYADVVSLINGLNATGVEYGRRLSPVLLTDLLDVTGRWVSEFVRALDPDAPALFAVAWAGENRSTNRFDTAREYTERWHHQMQVRDALGEAGHPEVLLAPRIATPLFEASMRALPHGYRDVIAPEGESVTVRLSGAAPLAWTLRREADRWVLYGGADARAATQVEVTPDALWRLLYNALPPDRARRDMRVSGPENLLAPLFRTRSVMV